MNARSYFDSKKLHTEGVSFKRNAHVRFQLQRKTEELDQWHLLFAWFPLQPLQQLEFPPLTNAKKRERMNVDLNSDLLQKMNPRIVLFEKFGRLFCHGLVQQIILVDQLSRLVSQVSLVDQFGRLAQQISQLGIFGRLAQQISQLGIFGRLVLQIIQFDWFGRLVRQISLLDQFVRLIQSISLADYIVLWIKLINQLGRLICNIYSHTLLET